MKLTRSQQASENGPMKISKAFRLYLREIASRGGKARAARHTKRQLRKWAAMGGKAARKQKASA